MTQPPEELLRELPPHLRWGPWPPHGDPIDMEFLLRGVDNPQVRIQLIALRLETVAQVMRVTADAAQKAAGLISSQL